jgi:tRNA 2-thiouridine synthesizing protein D
VAKLVVVVQTGPYAHQHLDTAIGLVRAALEAGHEAGIFLYIDGVLAANRHIDAPGERNLARRLEELAAAGVPVAACGACAKFRGLKKDAFLDGASYGSLVDLADMLATAGHVVTLAY